MSRNYLILLGVVTILYRANGKARMTEKLENLLTQKRSVSVLITMKESPQLFLTQMASLQSLDRPDRLSAIAHELQERTTMSQRNVLNLINRRRNLKTSAESLWVSNQLILKDTSPDMIRQLQQLDDIEEIREETFIEINPMEESIAASDLNRVAIDIRLGPWGVQKIEAPTVWQQGFRGQNVVVGIIDTGARGTHEALRSNYVGRQNYGWYDAVDGNPEPHDEHGHGTHALGTIVGQFNIGVAPGAKWMACKACASKTCSSFNLAKCLQFMACPTNVTGGSPDCGKAPQIVSNSWGGQPMNDFYQRYADTLMAAGIVLVFSIGNQGPFCGTAGSPGDYVNVIGVGATDSKDVMAGFSSAGPTGDGRMKPDIVAPGQSILSSYSVSDSSYGRMSGTSMACPHVAGVIALLLSKSPNLSPERVRSILINSTVPVTGLGLNCGGRSERLYPNNHAGFGRISALKAIRIIS